MDEELFNSPDAQNEGVEKKKRGRKPKAKIESAEGGQDVAEQPKRRRGRPPKVRVEELAPQEESSTPQSFDTSADEPEEYGEEASLFVHKSEDDFAYAPSREEEPQREEDNWDDDEIPQSFSTSDEDLDPEAYRRDADEEPAQERSSAPESDEEARMAAAEEYADRRANRWQNFRNKQNQQNRQNNNQRGNWQQRNNQQNQNFQQRGNWQQRNNQQSQNRNRQNQNQNQQNRQNRNQPQQRQQQRQQNQQIQQKNQKVRKTIRVTGGQDAMNPAQLWDFEALKTREAIAKWLYESFFVAPLSEVSAEQNSPAELQEPTLAPEVLETPPHEVANAENLAEKPEEPKQETPREVIEEYSAETARVFKFSDGKEISALDNFDEIYPLPLKEIQQKLDELGIVYDRGSGRADLMSAYLKHAKAEKKLVKISGVLDVFGDDCGGALTYASDNYALRRNCVYVPQSIISANKLQRGHEISVLAVAPRESEADTCPIAVRLVEVAGEDPAKLINLTPFADLTPYYPTTRFILEAPECAKWDNISMRAVDLLAPIGRGQRALIVAPPRTGKTVLMQGMAKSIRLNSPDVHLIVLLVDERPEEVTDFRRNVDAEVVCSTFDEDAESHVHAAEMVISKARRMVEAGKDVAILLDSITRLARAYNALMPNGGRTMSGGVEANALQKPKRFFGSARNIEGGGSLTIVGTALVETGSKMDEVIFEEFKGTGNLELHLDRQLSDKRIFPAINIEKSGTRKEELLYHPDEMKKIYSLRRAMKGVPTTDAMEMLVLRLKKVKTNIEFLMGLNS